MSLQSWEASAASVAIASICVCGRLREGAVTLKSPLFINDSGTLAGHR